MPNRFDPTRAPEEPPVPRELLKLFESRAHLYGHTIADINAGAPAVDTKKVFYTHTPHSRENERERQ
jgi:hypothetical protein